ncbi:MAG: hypothetical protein AAFV62_00020 [Pseudomonadota bacterium]
MMRCGASSWVKQWGRLGSGLTGLCLLLAGCAAPLRGEQAQFRQLLDAITYERAEFSPEVCRREADGHILVDLEGELYRVPVQTFLFASAALRPSGSVPPETRPSAGCPENPYLARSLFVSADPAGATATVRLGILADRTGRLAEARRERALTLIEDAGCSTGEASGYLRCTTTEMVGRQEVDVAYFFAASADAPVVNGAPFAVRCVDRAVSKPCSILDPLAGDATLDISFDPNTVDWADLFALHRKSRETVVALRHGVAT